MSEYVLFSEEFLRNVYDPATCSYMVPLSGKAAHDMRMLRDENATLKTENAKLREQLDWERSENGWMREFNDRMAEHCGTKDCPSLVAYINKIETESAKLRKLVRGLNWCTESTDGPRVDCERCPLGVGDGEPLELMCEKMMRELGIEVYE